MNRKQRRAMARGLTRAARAQVDPRLLRDQTKQQRKIERIIAREAKSEGS